MNLYIGGCAQGKLNYVLKRTGISSKQVAEGEKWLPEDELKEVKIINHFHLLVKRLIKDGGNPESLAEDLIIRCPQLMIISDEVGNGIVPMSKEDREYRERLGRILCSLAARAERVERIICGMGQRIK